MSVTKVIVAPYCHVIQERKSVSRQGRIGPVVGETRVTLSVPTMSCPWLLLLYILLADNISCAPTDIIILLVLGMVDVVHAQYS